MCLVHVVIDSNVLVSGLRSTKGTAYKLLHLIGSSKFTIHLSTPLIMEYEEVLKRQLPYLTIDEEDVISLLDYYISVGTLHEIFYLWRPTLRDPDDEMVLEVAVKGACSHIITFNKKDFRGVDQFGIELATPFEFLTLIGELK